MTRTWIIHNSRCWHKNEQDGVDGERELARRAEYNSSNSSSGSYEVFTGLNSSELDLSNSVQIRLGIVNRNNRLYFEPGPEPVYELCMCGMPNQGLDCCYHDLFLCGGKKRC